MACEAARRGPTAAHGRSPECSHVAVAFAAMAAASAADASAYCRRACRTASTAAGSPAQCLVSVSAWLTVPRPWPGILGSAALAAAVRPRANCAGASLKEGHQPSGSTGARCSASQTRNSTANGSRCGGNLGGRAAGPAPSPLAPRVAARPTPLQYRLSSGAGHAPTCRASSHGARHAARRLISSAEVWSRPVDTWARSS